MGWSRKRKKQEGKQGGKQEGKEGKKDRNRDNNNNNNNNNNNDGYNLLVQSNELMELYYAHQGLHNLRCIDSESDNNNSNDNSFKLITNETPKEKEDERELFMKTIRTILPTSFRISEHTEKVFLKVFLKELEAHLNTSTSEVVPSSHFKEIPYIPYGYQLAIDKRTIRKHKQLQDFHEWLKQQTLSGILTRQETVSMIPIQLLDIKGNHSVMDMCAAPGSKTCQILEKLNSTGTGFVLANDSDEKRAYTLIHQLSRMNSSHVVVTSCDAQKFPLPYSKEEGMFDRVLADVPCSGDGTVRKNPGIWRKWNTLGGLALHTVQLNIALRGASLTKVGGYICYSTCSLNPIENEAVVSQLLRICDGALTLVDKRSDMKGLKARPGLDHWKVIFSNEPSRKKKSKANRKKYRMTMEKEKKEKEQQAQTTPTAAVEEVAMDEEVNKQDSTSNKESTAKEADEEITTSTTQTVNTELKENKEETPLQFNRNVKTPTSNNYPPFSWEEDTVNQDNPNSLPNRLKKLNHEICTSYDEVPLKYHLRIRPSHFPPTETEIQSQLKHCIRVLPQDMDTGGFFVALFHKNAPINQKVKKYREDVFEETKRIRNEIKKMKENQSLDCKMEENDLDIDLSDNVDGDVPAEGEVDTTNEEKEIQSTENKESKDNNTASTTTFVKKDQTIPTEKTNFAIKPDPVLLDNLQKYYNLSSAFPFDQMYRRTGGEAKVLYYVHKSIQDEIFTHTRNIPITHTGVKLFSRNNNMEDNAYRITQDGIQYVAPFMTKSERYVVASKEEFLVCLQHVDTIDVGENKKRVLLGDEKGEIEGNMDEEKEIGVSEDGGKEEIVAVDTLPIDENHDISINTSEKEGEDKTEQYNPPPTVKEKEDMTEKPNNEIKLNIPPQFSKEFLKKVSDLTLGSFVIVLQNYETDYDKNMFISMWKCRSNRMSCSLNKIDIEDMKRKVLILG